ncbi:MAG TPA: hypothetical protein VF551_06815, partial [Chthoniobacterales bacterium]
LRAVNIYGDPRPWSAQKDAVFTALSFLNCAKYPPSLLYLLMTLGPGIMLLALFDRDIGKWSRPLLIFGRVPLFFYLLHLPLINGLAVVFANVRLHLAGGASAASSLSGDAIDQLPANYRYDLPAVYAVWLLTVLLLFPLCCWFAALKQRRRDVWLSYF